MNGATTFSPQQDFDWKGWINVFELGLNESAGDYIEGNDLSLENVPAEFNQLGITRDIEKINHLENWEYNLLNESERIGSIIKKRIIEDNL